MPGSLGTVSDRGSFCKLPTGPLAARPQVWAALPCTDGAVSRGGYRRAFNVMVFSVLSYGNQKWRLAGRGQRKRCPEAGCGRSWWQPCWPVGTAVPQVPRRNEAGPARRSVLALPPLARSPSLQPGTPPVCPEGHGTARQRGVWPWCVEPGSRRCWPRGRGRGAGAAGRVAGQGFGLSVLRWWGCSQVCGEGQMRPHTRGARSWSVGSMACPLPLAPPAAAVGPCPP